MSARDPMALLTIHETADWLRVSRMQLYRWRTTGSGPQWVRLGDRSVRYPAGAVEDYLRALNRSAA